jgi:hypothetical protein
MYNHIVGNDLDEILNRLFFLHVESACGLGLALFQVFSRPERDTNCPMSHSRLASPNSPVLQVSFLQTLLSQGLLHCCDQISYVTHRNSEDVCRSLIMPL